MKKIRNIEPGQRTKDRKAGQEALEKKMSTFLDHPKECCVCKTEFERTQETVKTWQVMVKGENVRLTCPRCSAIVATRLENEE